MNAVIHAFSPVGLTRIIYVLLIICSAAVTAYFGKQMGSDFTLVPGFSVLFWDIPDLSMGFFTAVGFAAISVLSAVFAYHAGWMHAEGLPNAKLVAQFAVIWLAADIFTNYMAWSTIRTQKAVISQNSNTVAGDIRNKIVRLRKAEGDLSAVVSAPGAWIASEDAEKALKDTLAARDREAARVRCGKECERLDLKARELRIEIAKSKTREHAMAERVKIRRQLAQAEAEARSNQVVIDPTNAQNKELASTFAGMAPSDKALFYAAKVIGIIGAVLFSLGASACGFLLGELTGRRSFSESQVADQPHYRAKLLESAAEFPPRPLQSSDIPHGASSSTSSFTLLKTGNKVDTSKLDEFMSMLENEYGAKRTT